MTDRQFRFLFCIPTTQLGGGVKVVFTIADKLLELGHKVEVFSYAGPPEWCKPNAHLIDAKDISDIDMTRYDFVVVSNAVLIPMVLPYLRSARCIFLAQDYESFHYSQESTFESFLAESPAFRALYALPVPIIATSKSIVRLVREHVSKKAYLMPVALNKNNFKRQTIRRRSDVKRVLLVGNYLLPHKGMRDGFDALEMLSGEFPLELVLITQEDRGRKLFDRYTFRKEVHFCPYETEVAAIMASCDAYCCTSWYEGLGLPALEAFSCGIPVVSTRTLGVDDYGKDGINLLLANPNDPADLRDKLRAVLSDPGLAERLVRGGDTTMEHWYDWDTSAELFMVAVRDIDFTYKGAGPIDAGEMKRMLDDLEQNGSLTPIEIFRDFQRLSDCLRHIVTEIAAAPPDAAQMEELSALKVSLGKYSSNARAQYHDAFKAKYDLCALVIHLAETPERKYLQRLLNPLASSPVTHAAALAEVRY